LISVTSITFGWNTDLEDGNTRTEGFTIGINTGVLVAAVVFAYKVITTGDCSPVPGLTPA